MKFAAAAMLSLLTLIQPAAAQQPAAAAPADAAKPGGTQADVAAATAAATSWLALTDAGNYAESWTQGGAAFRGAVSQPQWNDALRSVRAPLGAVKSRKLAASQYTRKLPGAPDGEYVVLQHQTEFASRAAMETVIATREADGSWKVGGYFIQ
jgi:hypothetical protein